MQHVARIGIVHPAHVRRAAGDDIGDQAHVGNVAPAAQQKRGHGEARQAVHIGQFRAFVAAQPLRAVIGGNAGAQFGGQRFVLAHFGEHRVAEPQRARRVHVAAACRLADGAPFALPFVRPAPADHGRADEDKAGNAFRVAQREVERHAAAHGQAEQRDLVHAQFVHRGQQVIGVGKGHAFLPSRFPESAHVMPGDGKIVPQVGHQPVPVTARTAHAVDQPKRGRAFARPFPGDGAAGNGDAEGACRHGQAEPM